MMEWGDRGLKDGQDVLDALLETRTGPKDGGPAFEMHRIMEPVHGRRITGLMADALDLAIARFKAAEASLAQIAEALGVPTPANPHGDTPEDIGLERAPSSIDDLLKDHGGGGRWVQGLDELWRVTARIGNSDWSVAALILEKLDDFQAPEVHDSIRNHLFHRIRHMPVIRVQPDEPDPPPARALAALGELVRELEDAGALGPFRVLETTVIKGNLPDSPAYKTVRLDEAR